MSILYGKICKIYPKTENFQKIPKNDCKIKKIFDITFTNEDRTIKIKEAGAIAEASLKINKIFEVAQQAADEYLKSIKKTNKNIENVRNRKIYRYKAKNVSKKYRKINSSKNSKELVLVNNGIMKITPKFFIRVLILFGNKAIYSVREVQIGDIKAVTNGQYNSNTGIWESYDAYTQYRAYTTKQKETTDSDGNVTQVSIDLVNTIHLVKININKISPLGVPIDGVKFKLQKVDDLGNIDLSFESKELVTSLEGKLSFVDLEYNTKIEQMKLLCRQC